MGKYARDEAPTAAERPQWLETCLTYLSSLPDSDKKTGALRWVNTHWPLLDRKVWGPLIAAVKSAERENPSLAGRWGYPDSAGGLCALVLESAVRWAADSKHKAATVRQRAARLLEVEALTLDALRTVLGLLEERDELIERGGFRTDPEAIVDGLEELIERAAVQYPHWHLVVDDELGRFLFRSKNTTNVAPRLRDLLEAAIGWPLGGDVIALHPRDAEVIECGPGGSPTDQAARVRQFLASLNHLCVRATLDEEPVGPLQWIGPTALAHLLSVVDVGVQAPTQKFESGRFHVDAVGKERLKYLSNKHAVNRQP